MSAITSAVEAISPEVARLMLATNFSNRNQKARSVAALAEAIRRGEWRMTGEAIKVDANGNLIDGQHRLSAVVEAGVSVEMLVVRGVDREAQAYMDSGSTRSITDALQLSGVSNAAIAGTTAKVVLLRDRLGLEGAIDMRGTLSRGQVLETAASLDRDFIRLVERTRRHTGLRPAMSAALLLEFSEIDQADCDHFFEKLGSGAGLAEGDAILTLRRFLDGQRTAVRKLPAKHVAAIVIKAWNRFRRGEQAGPQALRYRVGGSAPEAFPAAE